MKAPQLKTSSLMKASSFKTASHKIVSAGWDILSGLVDLAFPELCGSCRSCDVDYLGLCDQCNLDMLDLVSLPYCQRCGSVLDAGVSVRSDGCYNCPRQHYRFSRIYRLGSHRQPLRNIIHQIKYYRNFRMLKRIGALLAQAVSSSNDREEQYDVILSVPMHWRRRISRQCDHAHSLARAISRELNVPLGNAMVRVRNTPPQVGLSRAGRVKNVLGAFAIGDKRAIAGAKILLVDDVITTGATANEAARTLIEGGASSLHLAVIAKAGRTKPYA